MSETITAAEYRSRKRTWQRKYRNKPVVVDGVRHDSKREAARWAELQRLEQLGTIHRLRRQVPFELAKSVHLEGEKRAKPAIRYVADFVYFEGNVTVVEDVKSPVTAKTALFRCKRHLLKALYELDVRIVR
jgi:NADPH-dependent ferric siderophore reductase